MMTCNVRQNTVDYFKKNGYLSEYMIVQPMFGQVNREKSELARTKYGVTNQGNLFNTERLKNDNIKAVLNEEFFDELQAKHDAYYSEDTQAQLEDMPVSSANALTIAKVKEIAEKMGVSMQKLAEYAKQTGLNVKGINGVADLMRGIIAIAEGKEAVGITEEMVHIATAILEQTAPHLVTEMISKIDRFKIYKETLNAYRDNKAYQLPNGKPDIRKIKKEAVDKLIAEVLIDQLEGRTSYPELQEEENLSLVQKWWNTIVDFFRGQYKKANIDIFQEAAALIEGEDIGTIDEIKNRDIFYQLSSAQQAFMERIQQTEEAIKKVEGPITEASMLDDDNEVTNWYERNVEGVYVKIKNRVTDRVKLWYKERFGDKKFSDVEKMFNELKRKYGVNGHNDFQAIHGRYFNPDGTRKEIPDPRPDKTNIENLAFYTKLEQYFIELINKHSVNKDGTPNKIAVFAEIKIYDPKKDEAGTVDLLIVDEDGTGHIYDWKFMQVSSKSKDVPWFKQEAYNIQLKRYMEILTEYYGLKKIGNRRAIPILMEIGSRNTNVVADKYFLSKIKIGSVDPKGMTDLRLVPVSEASESTGIDRLDRTIAALNKVYDQIKDKQEANEDAQEFRIERLNRIKEAIRYLRILNLSPLITTIDEQRIKGQMILDDYNTNYKNLNFKEDNLSKERISEIVKEMREYIATAEMYSQLDYQLVDLIYTKELEQNAVTVEQKQDAAERKEYANSLTEATRSIKKSIDDLRPIYQEFVNKQIGLRNSTVGILSPEVEVKGLASTFRGVTQLPTAALQLLTRLTTDAQGEAMRESLKKSQKIVALQQRIKEKHGDVRKYISKIFKQDSKNKFTNKLINKYSKEFGKEYETLTTEGKLTKAWISENIDVEAYKAAAKARVDRKIKRVKESNSLTPEQKAAEIEKVRRQYFIDREDFYGWDNNLLVRFPAKKWYSAEYKELEREGAEALELYNLIQDVNKDAVEAGYISRYVYKTFLPYVRKSATEKIIWDGTLSGIPNSFANTFQAHADDVGYGKINQITEELEYGLPKYYTHDFSKKGDGTVDTSEVSEDVFKNMILYVQELERFKHLTEIEEQVKAIKDIETFKNHIVSDKKGDVVFEGGDPKKDAGNAVNAKLFDDFMRAMFYRQKYVLTDSDTPLHVDKVVNGVKKAINAVAGREVWKESEEASYTSLVKTLDAANRAFQLKTLGLEFMSGGANLFGANIQMSAQSGRYFKYREFLKNEGTLARFMFGELGGANKEGEVLTSLIETFMPLAEDPSYELYKKAGMHKLTQISSTDTLMVFMRNPEQMVEKSVFLTLLDNMMVDNGKIVNIKSYVNDKYKNRNNSAAEYRDTKDKIEQEIAQLKNEKSITKTAKMVDGKLVIEGLDLKNTQELQRLTRLTRTISRDITGSMSDNDMNRMQMSIWTKSMMIFKNWIPKLTDTRFSEFRRVGDDFGVQVVGNDKDGYSTIGEKYDVGRIRLWLHVIGTSIRDRSTNVINILNMNEKGIEAVNKLYEEYKQDFLKRTGKELNMSKEDFIDMVRTNLRNQMKEIAIMLSLTGALFSMGFIAPDDDDDKASKNAFRYVQRMLDKYADEVLFFYNPGNYAQLLSGAVFPAASLLVDIKKFVTHMTLEITGYDISDPLKDAEEVRKNAQPIKYLAKIFPVTKSAINYLAMFDEEFAKEYDITIPKSNNRR